MTKIKQNFIYNAIYQILILILPFITVPYVSRVLGADGIGAYSFTYSIVYYFMLVALLGINNHGNRAIAKVREDKNKLSKTFSSIYTIQLVASVSMILLYVLYLLLFSPDFINIAWIQIIYIFSSMFDVNWFFFGNEEFKLTVTRSIIIKLLSIGAIFLFVRTSGDVWIYTLILALSTLISQLVLWPSLIKRIRPVIPKKKEILKHLKPCLILFVPVVAVSLYKVMDKIMLGLMTDVAEVGYYEQAEKITMMPLGLVTALGTVMMPRMSNLAAKGHEEKMKEYIEKSISFMMFLAFPVCFGLIAVANNFVPLFMGDGFDKSIVLVQLLSVTILFIAFANTLRTGYLIPKERDDVYIKLTITGAIVNLVINLLLIPHLKSVGASIGTIIAELVVAIYQIMAVRNALPTKKYITNSSVFLIKAVIMFGIVIIIPLLNLSRFWTVGVQIITGGVVYLILNSKYVTQLIDYRFIRKGRK